MAYPYDYFQVDDDVTDVNIYDDGTETSLLILNEDQFTFWVNPLPKVCFEIDRV